MKGTVVNEFEAVMEKANKVQDDFDAAHTAFAAALDEYHDAAMTSPAVKAASEALETARATMNAAWNVVMTTKMP